MLKSVRLTKYHMLTLSCLYRLVRWWVIRFFKLKSWLTRQPYDLESAVLFGDAAMIRLSIATSFLYRFKIPHGIGVSLYDLSFPSPITVASFKGEAEVLRIWLEMGMGGVCLKTVMLQPRAGNARPRLQEVQLGDARGLLNAMGLPGPGVEGLVESVYRADLFSFRRPIGLSIGGNSLDDYKAVFDRIEEMLSCRVTGPYYYEINISCPNTPEGQQMSAHPELLLELLHYMRSKTDRVIGVKLSPDSSDTELLTIAKKIQPISKLYLNTGNTQYHTCESAGLPKHAISIGGGGLSGAPLYRRTLEMLRLLSPLGIPLIATGGISSAEQVRECLNLGATLVGMATGIVMDMYAIPEINFSLSK